MQNFTSQNKLLFSFLFFIMCLFLIPQNSFAQSLETQYKLAVNKSRPNKAGKIAYQIGQGYYKDGNEKEAINYLNKAYSHSANVKDYDNLGKIYSLLGGIYKKQKRYNDAITNYEKAAKVYDLLGNKKKVASSYYLGGVLYAETKQYNRAIYNFEETMRIARQANDAKLILQSTEYLSKVHKAKGDNSNAQLYANLTEKIRNPAEKVINLEEKKDNVLKDSLNFTASELKKKKEEVAVITNQQKLITQQQIDELLAENSIKADSLKDVFAHIEALEAENKADEKLFTYIVGGVAFFAIILIIFIIIQSSTVRAKKKANKELESANYELAAKNEEIEQQKETIEQEKERSEALLLNILPKEIAEELKHNVELRPRSYDQVTVIFTDFKGFTQAAELLTPEELIDELAECFSEFDTICERWNLERIKTIGDAYMCAGGVPTANYTNPVDAVSAAMEMQEVIEQLKQKKILQGKPYFDMRLGIHTGAVVAGVVGKKRFAYDIWGDTVNLAARMESSGEIGRVNISEYTYSLVRDYFFCSYRGKVQAKNKGEVDMYFVVSKF
ncbi:family 3 adenylate cyclase [Bernardetia litoralis DSM 6794]|uniref:Adenylate cyclase n=1 Tax=Bernardetia litoralis (strain ATCC 23117 / DSM 6794 / NBRC 15988 / NCIMB 1366 / Fx l1 / Sio-4) TaxID=880071 RepID=I4AF81_BERLS|nr:adenylate/guanylate cyclase domain-containing protein [Bernardetia litoralis]AFM02616.1 family 3 adenylate cyclase [Bernardetia litoralis DSM 6794]